MFRMQKLYDTVQSEAEHFQVVLESYPDKGTAEYSRLEEALRLFLSCGYFGEEEE